jgi:hypothetical protein
MMLLLPLEFISDVGVVSVSLTDIASTTTAGGHSTSARVVARARAADVAESSTPGRNLEEKTTTISQFLNDYGGF